MAAREWNDLPQNTHYTITAMNGWTLTKNNDGTVTLKHGGNQATVSAATSMTIDPDPGAGTTPPGK